LQFAAKVHKVKVSLKDLGFRPPAFHSPGEVYLSPLLGKRSWSTALAQFRVDEGDELHRNRTGAARHPANECVHHGAEHRPAIDAAMAVKSPVLAGDNRRPYGRGDVCQRRPGEPASMEIDPPFMYDVAMPVQQADV
jgi:hypothetical protein